ncbi:hypothetical protein EVAR_88135_1 [Eumeta japonica]|uniref:MADF domain-containing protein n=1 Tax=Eumeta variegata TaxID=151549 RepID=A0A4C1WPP3_EUMVA|nr:hypothetical protein EVAR_88135_1 [Eumeta japonica]
MDNFDTERFIIEIKSRPSIWDNSSSDNSDRDLKKKCWEEVVDLFREQEQAVAQKKSLALNNSIEQRRRETTEQRLRDTAEIDEDRPFLLSLLTTLKNLPPQVKMATKIKMLTLLIDASGFSGNRTFDYADRSFRHTSEINTGGRMSHKVFAVTTRRVRVSRFSRAGRAVYSRFTARDTTLIASDDIASVNRDLSPRLRPPHGRVHGTRGMDTRNYSVLSRFDGPGCGSASDRVSELNTSGRTGEGRGVNVGGSSSKSFSFIKYSRIYKYIRLDFIQIGTVADSEIELKSGAGVAGSIEIENRTGVEMVCRTGIRIKERDWVEMENSDGLRIKSANEIEIDSKIDQHKSKEIYFISMQAKPRAKRPPPNRLQAYMQSRAHSQYCGIFSFAFAPVRFFSRMLPIRFRPTRAVGGSDTPNPFH